VNWALAELDAAWPLELSTWPSLEAQVASISDDIAYDNHDIDDGLRAGFLELDDLLTLDFLADQWRAVERRFPGAARDRQLRELIRSQIGLMVNDLIAETRARSRNLASPDDVRRAGRPTAAFSSGLASSERQLKRFMYDRLYYHPEQVATAERAKGVTATLFAAYLDDPGLMDAGWTEVLPAAEPAHSRHIADFIAGMTDRYALACYNRLTGDLPEGLRNV
jgi:dGTPase